MSDQIITFIMYCVPALIVGAVAFYFLEYILKMKIKSDCFFFIKKIKNTQCLSAYKHTSE